MIYVGIDLHSSNMVLAAVNDNGHFLCEKMIPCELAALSDFFNKISRPVKAVVESTCSWLKWTPNLGHLK